MDRREFLKASGLLGTAALAGAPELLTASAPQKFRIGLAATQWLQAEASAKTYWQACKEIGSLGFRGTEADDTLSDLDIDYGEKIADFKRETAKYGPELKGIFYLFHFDPEKMPGERKRAAHICRFLNGVGARYIATGEGIRLRTGSQVNFKEEAREEAQTKYTARDVKNAIQGLNELGKLCKEDYGVAIAFHPGRNQTKELIQQVLNETDQRYVSFCADVGHLTGAGYDPVEAVRTYASRLVASHWKDYDPNIPLRHTEENEGLKGDFVELGKGIVNFPALAELLGEIGYSGWVMLELDRTMTTPLESAREMKAYVVDKLKLQV